MTAIIEKLNFLLTPKEICEGTYRGINNCYNNSTRKKEKRNTNNPIDANEIIGWQNFYRVRVFKKLTSAMEQHCLVHPGNPNFTGRG